MIELLQNFRNRIFRRSAPDGSGRNDRVSGEIGTGAPADGRPRIGIALSSGGAKGLAHIGVIQVLEEHGIEIDVIAGASMGAYVGALWAAGFTGKQLEELAAEMKTRKHFMRLADPVFPPSQGFLRGHKVKEHLLKSLGNRTFADVEKELYVIATNLDTLERKIFSEGDIATAVHASIAIPGVCVPVEIDGVYYSDGGICDPLPVGVLRNAGVDHVIAVSTLPGPDDLASCREEYLREDPPKNFLFRAGRAVNREVNIFARGNMIDILRSAAYGSQIRLANHVGKQADILIRAVLCDGRWHDYAGYERYIKLGRELTEQKIDEIKELVRPRAAA